MSSAWQNWVEDEVESGNEAAAQGTAEVVGQGGDNEPVETVSMTPDERQEHVETEDSTPEIHVDEGGRITDIGDEEDSVVSNEAGVAASTVSVDAEDILSEAENTLEAQGVPTLSGLTEGRVGVPQFGRVAVIGGTLGLAGLAYYWGGGT
jgi:hypothetical protein